MKEATAGDLVAAARQLRQDLAGCSFGAPVSHLYRPLDYAWEPHRRYLERFGGGRKRVLFLGMNPGPFGMAQTGVPFGEVAIARDWLGLAGPVGRPDPEHPKRPVEGFACPRSEVSGRRLWGLFADRFGTPDAFFAGHLVLNYCPLVWMTASGANLTPDKLPAVEMEGVEEACLRHLVAALRILQPAWLIGVGGYAEERLRRAVARLADEAAARTRTGDEEPRVARILHPSPASPAANRGWAAAATRQLEALGVW
jgi:single-strand selective monofunctional uracil DNA glycosylase